MFSPNKSLKWDDLLYVSICYVHIYIYPRNTIHINIYIYNILYTIPPASYFTADFKKRVEAPRLGVAFGRSGSQFPIQSIKSCGCFLRIGNSRKSRKICTLGRWADGPMLHLKIFLSREMAHPWWPHFKTVTMASWDVAVIKMLAFKSGRIR